MSQDSDGRPLDDRPAPMAEGMIWVSEITSIGMLVVVPAMAGYFVDQWLGTRPWVLVAGTIFGFVLMLTSLIGLADRAARRAEQTRGRRSKGSMIVKSELSDGDEPSGG